MPPTHPPRSRPSIVSNGEFETDKESLLRMLQDFQADRPQFARAAAATAATAAAAAGAAHSSTGTPASGSGGGGGARSVGGGAGAAASPSSSAGGAHSSGGGSGGGVELGVQELDVAGAPSDMDAVGAGMASVMACYEAELKSPMRNLVAGDLARTLLIQVRPRRAGKAGWGVQGGGCTARMRLCGCDSCSVFPPALQALPATRSVAPAAPMRAA